MDKTKKKLNIYNILNSNLILTVILPLDFECLEFFPSSNENILFIKGIVSHGKKDISNNKIQSDVSDVINIFGSSKDDTFQLWIYSNPNFTFQSFDDNQTKGTA